MRLYASVYEFRPLSEEVTNLRLGAVEACRLDVRKCYRVCEPLCQRRRVAYIEFARTLSALHYKGLNVHKVGALLITHP